MMVMVLSWISQTICLENIVLEMTTVGCPHKPIINFMNLCIFGLTKKWIGHHRNSLKFFFILSTDIMLLDVATLTIPVSGQTTPELGHESLPKLYAVGSVKYPQIPEIIQ